MLFFLTDQWNLDYVAPDRRLFIALIVGLLLCGVLVCIVASVRLKKWRESFTKLQLTVDKAHNLTMVVLFGGSTNESIAPFIEQLAISQGLWSSIYRISLEDIDTQLLKEVSATIQSNQLIIAHCGGNTVFGNNRLSKFLECIRPDMIVLGALEGSHVEEGINTLLSRLEKGVRIVAHWDVDANRNRSYPPSLPLSRVSSNDRSIVEWKIHIDQLSLTKSLFSLEHGTKKFIINTSVISEALVSDLVLALASCSLLGCNTKSLVAYIQDSNNAITTPPNAIRSYEVDGISIVDNSAADSITLSMNGADVLTKSILSKNSDQKPALMPLIIVLSFTNGGGYIKNKEPFELIARIAELKPALIVLYGNISRAHLKQLYNECSAQGISPYNVLTRLKNTRSSIENRIQKEVTRHNNALVYFDGVDSLELLDAVLGAK